MFLPRLERTINRVLRRFNRQLRPLGHFEPLESILARSYHPDFFFVQIGGNDGAAFDPIHAFVTSRRCRGVVVEPVKEYFAQLGETYRQFPEVLLVNKAIRMKPGEVSMYRVDSSRTDLPGFARGIASVDPLHHKRSGMPSDAIVEERVDAITFEALLDLCGVDHIDLLQVDAEGCDYEILTSVDFDRVVPRVINFEHGLPHQIMSVQQLQDLVALLVGRGYKILIGDYDCLAFR